MTWKIQAITGDLTGQEISIDRDMLVGRHQAADLVLQAAEISRKHAGFLLKEQALWVHDLNSSNGTFVNDARIEGETRLQNEDIVQFASIKFLVLEPAEEIQVSPAITETVEALQEPTVEVVEVKVEPQAEVVVEAAPIVEAEPVVAPEPVVKTAAEQMNEQGMPDLKERDASVQLTRDGMPQGVAVPKPAPIPEGTDLTSVKPEPVSIPVEQPVSRVELAKEEQKNASVGLISVIVLVVFAILAWLLFK